MPRYLRNVLALLSAVWFLAACGQKGELYRPDQAYVEKHSQR